MSSGLDGFRKRGRGYQVHPARAPVSPSLCSSASFPLTCQDVPLAPGLEEGDPPKPPLFPEPSPTRHRAVMRRPHSPGARQVYSEFGEPHLRAAHPPQHTPFGPSRQLPWPAQDAGLCSVLLLVPASRLPRYSDLDPGFEDPVESQAPLSSLPSGSSPWPLAPRGITGPAHLSY